jgi:hypothetical protein
MGRQTDIGDGVTEGEPGCTKNKLLFDHCIVQSLWVTYTHYHIQSSSSLPSSSVMVYIGNMPHSHHTHNMHSIEYNN